MSSTRLDRGTKIYAASIAAQKKLAKVQAQVRELVEFRPDIERVSWRVDAEWFAERGVLLRP